MSNDTEKHEIQEFVGKLALDQGVTAEQYRLGVKSAIKDRAIIF